MFYHPLPLSPAYRTALLAIVLLVFSITSCTGQAPSSPKEPSATQPSQTDSNSGYTAWPPLGLNPNSIPNDRLLPLFYEGQLAHWIRGILEDKHGNLWL